jgi:AraC-like DNA-binding protein
MRPSTIERHRLLYLQAHRVIARHYRRQLRLEEVARQLASSPRQLKRAYAQCGHMSFREDLLTRRLSVAARVLIEYPAVSVRDVARLVGFSQAPHFAKAFRRRYGLTPMRFRAEARAQGRRTTASLSVGGVRARVDARQRVILDRRGAGQAQPHQRSLSRDALRGDAAAVLFGHLSHDRKTEP